MKVKIVVIGVLTIIAGLIPILDSLNVFSSPFPTTGWIYAAIIIAIGIVDLLYSFLAHIDLIGFQHVVTGVIAGLTIAAGVLPFLKGIIPSIIPMTGIAYYAIIVVIGILGSIYGFTQLRY